MTTYKHTFIELDDLLALRLTCSECKSSLSIPLHGERIGELIVASNKVLANCPSCSHIWLQYTSGIGWESELKEMLRALQVVRAATNKFGCALSFELSAEVNS